MDHVCMVVLSLYPQDERVRRQAEALEREGIAVDVICLRGDGQSKTERLGLVTTYRVIRESSKDDIIRYLYHSLVFMLAASMRMIGLSFKKKYALVQAHNMPDFLIFTGLFHKILGRPVVLVLHDLSVELFMSKWAGWKSKILIPCVKLAEKLSCRFADHLITASTGFCDLLAKRGHPSSKTTLVLNTADSNIFHARYERDFEKIERGAKLLYHGTVVSRFGLANAIRALEIVRRRIPDSTLHIYGKYNDGSRKELRDVANELNLSDCVFLHDHRPLEEICGLIKDADIGLAPYLSDIFTNLILPTKILEYAHMRLPVVASKLDGIHRVFDEGCVSYVEQRNVDQLADKITELCLNPELRRSLAENAEKAIAELNWPVMADRYVRLVRQLTQTGPASEMGHEARPSR